MKNLNMADLFGRFRDMQSKMEEMQKSLEQVVVEADAGGGMVKVKANGKRRILSVKLDPVAVDPADPEMLEDLITAGVNRALEKAEAAAQEKMAELSSGMLPGGIPGFDPSKLGL